MPTTDQYASLVAVRHAELETYWTRYNIQVVLNGGLLVAAFATESRSRLAGLPIWLVSLGGVALAIVWLIMVLQGKAWVHRWDAQLSLFEKQLGANQLYPLFTNIRDSGAALSSWANITAVAAAVPILCGLAWFATLCRLVVMRKSLRGGIRGLTGAGPVGRAVNTVPTRDGCERRRGSAPMR
jgi:hypothetical protein